MGEQVYDRGTCLLSGVLLLVTALLFQAHDLTATSLTMALTIIFFIYGTKAERRGLEDIAQPLTAAETTGGTPRRAVAATAYARDVAEASSGPRRSGSSQPI